MTKTVDELVDDLVRHGGAIVSSGECSEVEIAEANACGRFAVRDDGMGFVRRMQQRDTGSLCSRCFAVSERQP